MIFVFQSHGTDDSSTVKLVWRGITNPENVVICKDNFFKHMMLIIAFVHAVVLIIVAAKQVDRNNFLINFSR